MSHLRKTLTSDLIFLRFFPKLDYITMSYLALAFWQLLLSPHYTWVSLLDSPMQYPRHTDIKASNTMSYNYKNVICKLSFARQTLTSFCSSSLMLPFILDRFHCLVLFVYGQCILDYSNSLNALFLNFTLFLIVLYLRAISLPVLTPWG